MHIEKYSVAGISYLRLVASKRVINKRGKSVTGKRLVLSLGPLSKHDDGKPEYLERLRASFSAGNPLIQELGPYVGDAPKERYTLTFDAGDKLCVGNPKRMATCVLDPVFRAHGLRRTRRQARDPGEGRRLLEQVVLRAREKREQVLHGVPAEAQGESRKLPHHRSATQGPAQVPEA